MPSCFVLPMWKKYNIGEVSFYLSTHDDTDRTPSSMPIRCWKQYVSDQYLIGSTNLLLENKILNKLLYQLTPETGDDRFSSTRVGLFYCVTVTQKAIGIDPEDILLKSFFLYIRPVWRIKGYC